MAKFSHEQISFWIEEIKSCEQRQRAELITKNYYPELIKYYEGEQYRDSAKKISIINDFFPNTNALISELMYQNPDIITTPTKPQADKEAPTMKGALTYAFNKLDALTENKLALFDMLYAGYCGVEVNHISTKFLTKTERFSIPEYEQKNIFQRAGDAIRKVTGSQKDIEKELQKDLPPPEYNYATADETYLKRWNPLDILLDWRAERIKDMRYIIKIIRKSKAEFDATYPKFANRISGESVISYAQHRKEADKKTVILYEIQIKKADNKCCSIIISKNYNRGEIDYFERPYTTNGFNLKISTLHEYGKLYPVSFAKVNKPIQDDLVNYVTFMMETAERNIPKRGYNKNNVKEDGLEALKSNKVNDVVPVDGGKENIWTIDATTVSPENKELIALFNQQKEKLWNVSESRLLGKSGSEFATEIQIQEAGFQARQSTLQQGLQRLIVAELDTLKDIIVQFWDGEYFFKVTGQDKPSWYIPQIDPIDNKTILNPLTEILTADYEIKIDILSAFKPNKQKKRAELTEFAKWITSPQVVQFCQLQGFKIDIDVIRKVATEWGWNPDNIIKPIEVQNAGMSEMPPESGIPANILPQV